MIADNDVLKMFREDEKYKAILRQAKTKEERDAIRHHAESFVSDLYNSVLSQIDRALAEDPDAIKKAVLEIEKNLIKEREAADNSLAPEQDANRSEEPR